MFSRALFAALTIGGFTAGSSPAAPAYTATPNGTAAAIVRIANKSEHSVQFVHISPCAADSWGDDQLGLTETIPVGDVHRWRVQSGCYDVKADLGTDGGTIEWRGLELDPGDALALVVPTRATVRSADLIR